MNHRDTPRATPAPGLETAAAHRTGAGNGRRGYGLAVMVAVIGALAAAVWAVTGYLDQIQRPEQFARTEIPGTASVAITQAGLHVVFVESAGPADLTAADLTVIGPSGAPVGIRPYALDLRYDVPGTPGQVGTGVAVFTADRTGTYQVGTQAISTDKKTLAVGDDLAPEVVRAVAVPSTIGILVVLVGLGLALVTWIRDERRSQS